MIDDITPLRDVFNSLFFVSMGMLVEPRLWVERPPLTIGSVAGVMALKAVVTAGVAWPFLRNPAAAAAVGLGLAQVGEFSIVIGAEASRLGWLTADQQQLFLAIAVPTMVLTPFVMDAGRRIARRRAGLSTMLPVPQLSDHVVIVGYGVNGRNVARALSLLEVPHVVVDLNLLNTVDEVRAAGGHALEGDARQAEVLEAAGMGRARGLAAAVADVVSTREVVETARSLNPNAQIIAPYPLSARSGAAGCPRCGPGDSGGVRDLARAHRAGARSLRRPAARGRTGEGAPRREGYGLLRGEATHGHLTLDALCQLPGVNRVPVPAESAAAGRTLRELDIRNRTGALTVLAVERGGELQVNPPPELQLEVGDGLFAFADGAALDAMTTAIAPK